MHDTHHVEFALAALEPTPSPGGSQSKNRGATSARRSARCNRAGYSGGALESGSDDASAGESSLSLAWPSGSDPMAAVRAASRALTALPSSGSSASTDSPTICATAAFAGPRNRPLSDAGPSVGETGATRRSHHRSQCALQSRQFSQRLFILRRDQRRGNDEPGGGGGAERDPRVFLCPGPRIHTLPDARRHIVPRCDIAERARSV